MVVRESRAAGANARGWRTWPCPRNRQVCLVGLDHKQTGLYSQAHGHDRNRKPSARERLLAAANELFYEEGVHTVGIDRVIERAGVAKASLYCAFGSKEELVRAYLEARADGAARADHRGASRASTRPREQHPRRSSSSWARLVAEPTFRGCAFVNASAEGPKGPSKVRDVCTETRGWLRGAVHRPRRASRRRGRESSSGDGWRCSTMAPPSAPRWTATRA